MSVAWQDNCCSAATLRALTLPKVVNDEIVINPAKRLAHWLKRTEDRGHIQHGTLLIRALNPTVLHQHSMVYLPADTYTARDFLSADAIGDIETQIIEERNPAVAERRWAELDLLRAAVVR
ncbi:MAG: hypothetical protein QOF66_323 [Mycobacterium sp.]|uniref:hypothetical protein n=1 Tax=Mycobacterium sp. TaxID=1785 RepID=UPI0028B4C2B6|nr:hypothetical protein [Mycobacterium sp.]